MADRRVMRCPIWKGWMMKICDGWKACYRYWAKWPPSCWRWGTAGAVERALKREEAFETLYCQLPDWCRETVWACRQPKWVGGADTGAETLHQVGRSSGRHQGGEMEALISIILDWYEEEEGPS